MHEVAGSSPASATTSTHRSCKRFRPPGKGFPHILHVRLADGGDTLAYKVPMDVRYALNPVGSLVGRHLLVVEHDKDARDVFCAMLDYEGAMVLGTGSAEEALAVLKTVRPHAIVVKTASASSALPVPSTIAPS